MPIIRTIFVPGASKPEYFPRLDRFLASSFPDLSRSQIKNLIVTGSVLCNDNLVVKPSYKVSSGNTITITLPDPVALSIEPENIPVDIIYQDDEIAVINKSAGMIVHPAGQIVSGTLVNALLFHMSGLSGINGVLKPGIVHRLDKDTSG
ncbi:pseudouridine synthase, partial [bacterium SM23_31]